MVGRRGWSPLAPWVGTSGWVVSLRGLLVEVGRLASASPTLTPDGVSVGSQNQLRSTTHPDSANGRTRLAPIAVPSNPSASVSART